MRAWLVEGYDPAAEYAALREGLLFSRCWACGDTRCPAGFFAPWSIERAHIVNKPRREDRRAVIGLCSVCHRVSHGERLSGLSRVRLGVEHMLWLKRWVDTDWYDPEFLQTCSVRRLPEPEMPELSVLLRFVKGKWVR